ncbi:MAG: transposase [Cellvibrio sp.]|nr:transposase [Cellvibrio sp.]
MPRRARHYIANQPYHIAQRGNNREPCFIEIEIENYQFYLELWRELSKKFDITVHAYCLMTNHFIFSALTKFH